MIRIRVDSLAGVRRFRRGEMVERRWRSWVLVAAIMIHAREVYVH